jgi:hypothetical protein
MCTRNAGIIFTFTIFGAAWVGGWGFVMYRCPAFLARIYTYFGFRRLSSPGYIAFIRWMGMLEMVLAALSAQSSRTPSG